MARCIVQKSCPSSNVKVRGQGQWGQTMHLVLPHLRVHTIGMRSLQTAAVAGPISWLPGGVVQLCRLSVLCRWENQRMLSSSSLFLSGRSYSMHLMLYAGTQIIERIMLHLYVNYSMFILI